jgi:AcrR family transcriptional regulator
MYSSRSERQQQIIYASIKLIHSHGIQGLTIKNLSKAIDVTEAAIYRHFKNKDEILYTILEDFRANLKLYSNSVLESDNKAKDKLYLILNKLIEVFCENPYIVSVIFSDEIFRNRRDLYDKIGQIITQNNQCFLRIIEEGQKANEIRKELTAAEISVIVMGSFRFTIKNWQMSRQSYSLKEKGEEFLHSLFKLIFI